jgi:hypothetical protein
MATCVNLTGIVRGCDNNIGGIVGLWLADQEDISAVGEAAGVVGSITMVAPAVFVGYEFRRNTGSFTEEAAIDLVNGSTFYTQTINLMFHRREATKSQEIQIMAAGQRDLVAIVKDANGLFWYFDKLQLTAVGEGSGQAKADGSKYAISLVAESEHLAWETSQAVLDSVL